MVSELSVFNFTIFSHTVFVFFSRFVHVCYVPNNIKSLFT